MSYIKLLPETQICLIIMSHDLVWDFQPTVYWQQDFSLYVSTVDTEPSPMMKRQ